MTAYARHFPPNISLDDALQQADIRIWHALDEVDLRFRNVAIGAFLKNAGRFGIRSAAKAARKTTRREIQVDDRLFGHQQAPAGPRSEFRGFLLLVVRGLRQTGDLDSTLDDVARCLDMPRSDVDALLAAESCRYRLYDRCGVPAPLRQVDLDAEAAMEGAQKIVNIFPESG